MQVSIVSFKKGKLQVLAHAWDRNLGGRDFDEVLYDHFCEEFGAKHKIDIKSNARASFRLRMACEKASYYMPHRHMQHLLAYLIIRWLTWSVTGCQLSQLY